MPRAIAIILLLAANAGFAFAYEQAAGITPFRVPSSSTLPPRQLIDALTSANATVRASAAWQLRATTELKDEARAALKLLVAGDPDRTVRYAAAWAMAKLDFPRPDHEQGITIPKPLKITRPNYPQSAFANKIQGTVLVEILIGEDGEVAHGEVIRPIPGLDAAAIDCLRGWRFSPGRENGKPRPFVAQAPISFRISD